MTEQKDQFHVEKPVWKPVDSGWWLTIAGGVAAAVLLLFPSLTNASDVIRFSVMLLIFAASPFLLRWITFQRGWISTWQQKASKYDSLYQAWVALGVKLKVANDTLLKLRDDASSYVEIEIGKVLFYGEKVHLVLVKTDNFALPIGQEVIVIDSVDGLPLGQFVICTEREKEYIAQLGDYIDPVWHGYIRRTGKPEMSPPPTSVAITQKGPNTRNV